MSALSNFFLLISILQCIHNAVSLHIYYILIQKKVKNYPLGRT